jgi:hypothetical protein
VLLDRVLDPPVQQIVEKVKPDYYRSARPAPPAPYTLPAEVAKAEAAEETAAPEEND